MNMLVHEILAFEMWIELISGVFSSPIQAWTVKASLAAS